MKGPVLPGTKQAPSAANLEMLDWDVSSTPALGTFDHHDVVRNDTRVGRHSGRAIVHHAGDEREDEHRVALMDSSRN